jgi:hypothetical protein
MGKEASSLRMGPCKKCGGTRIASRQTGEGNFRIKCIDCGHIIISSHSAEDVVSQWNDWKDGPEIPADPNIPVSPDGKFQVYQLKARQKDGSSKIVYAVAVFPELNGYGDSLHDTLDEAVKESDMLRKEYEAKEKRRAEEKLIREQQAEETRKWEDLHGFTDNMPPMQRGRAVAHMQKKWRFYVDGTAKVMTMKEFIHYLYLKGGAKVRVSEDKRYSDGRDRPEPKLRYLIDDEDVGKIAYDYFLYLDECQIKIEPDGVITP